MPNGGQLIIGTKNIGLDRTIVERNIDLGPGEYVMVTVTDTGQGMSAETLERASDPFFTTKQPGMGTGLGLSMVFGFVRQSGGQVRILSELGKGTSVHLYLPRGSSEQKTAPNPSPKELGKVDGGRVLIVEDSIDLAKSAQRVLTDRGYDAIVASNAEEALKVLKEQVDIDVVFTDIVLSSGMDGLELASEAERLSPGIGIVLCSGFSESALRKTGGMKLPGAFLAKPYRIRDMVSLVTEQVERRRAR